jgi:hypothetical protein
MPDPMLSLIELEAQSSFFFSKDYFRINLKCAPQSNKVDGLLGTGTNGAEDGAL